MYLNKSTADYNQDKKMVNYNPQNRYSIDAQDLSNFLNLIDKSKLLQSVNIKYKIRYQPGRIQFHNLLYLLDM